MMLTEFKKCESESCPIVFTRGNIEIQIRREGYQAEVFIPKIVNYSEENFTHLTCYIIATDFPVNRNFINLCPGDF